MYTGHINVNGTSLFSLTKTADKFGIGRLRAACICFLMERLAISNCWETFLLADRLSFPDLRSFALQFIGENFEEACRTPEFFCLSQPVLKEIARSDDLSIRREECLYQSIVKWAAGGIDPSISGSTLIADSSSLQLSHDEIRHFRQSVVDLLLHVRFPLIDHTYLRDVIAHDDFVRGDLDLMTTVQDAYKQLESLVSKSDPVSPLPQGVRRRKRKYEKHLLFTSDADDNGVFYYIGTEFGTRPWQNPVLAKRSVITCSTSENPDFPNPTKYLHFLIQKCTSDIPWVIFPRNPRENVSPNNTAWVEMDIGAGHTLICDHYTLRHTCVSRGYLRNWRLQGSSDGIAWQDLSVHASDSKISAKNQYASWRTTERAANVPYRYFRILMDGPNSGNDALYSFNVLQVSFVELYGQFR
mmetsp:Transcript_16516/g.27296  ORF Transcript_16516/g.27296 Transcript_16516/m.27296 type:complete len:413 (-) Transcript_16516:120-1358(-)